MIYALIGAMIGVIFVLIGFMFIMNAKHFTVIQAMSVREFDREQAWNKERQMLLDRIQAPSFAEYTSKVVREKKAAQPEEPKVIDDYVS